MADVFCRGCRARFERPLPQPYGSICPFCVARGQIITLTAAPDDADAARPGVSHQHARSARAPSRAAPAHPKLRV
jgi:hypothetical protein